MFSKILRLGPFVILQFMMLLSGVILYQLINFKAAGLTFMETSLEIFLVQMVISINMIKRQRKYKDKYIKKLAASSNLNFYGTLIWNQMQYFAIFGLFLWTIIKDGIQLHYHFNDPNCTFILYPLIYQLDLNIDNQLKLIIMWIAYAFFILFNFLLIGLSQKRQYNYSTYLIINRDNIVHELNEQLLALSQKQYAHLLYYECYQGEQLNSSDKNTECSFCLGEFSEDCKDSIRKDTIKLYCRHKFHRICAQKWLKQKKICPMRCLQNN